MDNSSIYLHTLCFSCKWNEPYLPSPSQLPQLVLIYLPRRDGRLRFEPTASRLRLVYMWICGVVHYSWFCSQNSRYLVAVCRATVWNVSQWVWTRLEPTQWSEYCLLVLIVCRGDYASAFVGLSVSGITQAVVDQLWWNVSRGWNVWPVRLWCASLRHNADSMIFKAIFTIAV